MLCIGVESGFGGVLVSHFLAGEGWSPGMSKTARDEFFDEIADWFETSPRPSAHSANRLQKALDALVDGAVAFGAELAAHKGSRAAP